MFVLLLFAILTVINGAWSFLSMSTPKKSHRNIPTSSMPYNSMGAVNSLVQTSDDKKSWSRQTYNRLRQFDECDDPYSVFDAQEKLKQQQIQHRLAQKYIQ
jgi:hypothetical protein